jgi:hypothetical protein
MYLSWRHTGSRQTLGERLTDGRLSSNRAKMQDTRQKKPTPTRETSLGPIEGRIWVGVLHDRSHNHHATSLRVRYL